MPSIDDFFPSRWLKPQHITLADGRRPVITVEIAAAGPEMVYSQEERGDVPRLTVEFVGRDKRLIVNKTQAEAIAALCGRDYTQWRGKRIAIQAGTAPSKRPTILILAPTMTPTPTNTNGKAETMIQANTNGQDYDPDPNHNQEQDTDQ